jgi:Uma2 family endonuclease
MISVSAYLENERSADLRSEYVRGRSVPLIGANQTHDQLCMRLARALRAQLNDGEHRLYRPTVKLHIRNGRDERYYYPDLQIAKADVWEHPDYLEQPVLIIEVFTAADESRLRREKLPAYLGIPSLRELVLIGVDPATAEVYRRNDAWTMHDVATSGRLRLETIDSEIGLSGLFAGPRA